MQAILAIALAILGIAIVIGVTNLTARCVRRYKLQPWIVGLVGGFFIAAISVLAAIIFFFIGPKDAPLTADLNGDKHTVSAAFDARVKTAFPVGAAESVLAKTLETQGFVRADWVSLNDAEHEAI